MTTDEKVKLNSAIIDLLKDVTFTEKYRILLSVLQLSCEDDDKIEIGFN